MQALFISRDFLEKFVCFYDCPIITNLCQFNPCYDAQIKGIDLNEQDKKILEIGEITTARYVTGGILRTYPLGLAIGHAII